MRWWRLALVHAVGCAQLAGIEKTTGRDAGQDASDAAGGSGPDAAPCVGGDARTTDPMTGACYVFFAAEQPRDAARATCAALGAGTLLASVQSASENALITALIGQNLAFLGGTDEVTEGVFKWEDGSDVVLTNWNTGEPNNGLGMFEEDCIVIHGDLAGKWDDRPCAPVAGLLVPGAYPFVCERD